MSGYGDSKRVHGRRFDGKTMCGLLSPRLDVSTDLSRVTCMCCTRTTDYAALSGGNVDLPRRRRPPQHNHHCIVSFAGLNWRIVRVEWLRRHLYLETIAPPRVRTILDLTHIDMDSYVAACVKLIKTEENLREAHRAVKDTVRRLD